MKPLLVLLGMFVLSLLILKIFHKTTSYQLAGKIAIAVMLVFTAIGHIVFTDGMATMIPNFFPAKTCIVYATGIVEVLFAIGILIPAYQKITGWVLFVFLILVLPANIKASIENINYQTGEYNGSGLAYLWFRIPLQLFFLGWIYFFVIRK